MTDPGWDKKMAARIRQLGIDHEKAMQVVGIIAEERQIADQCGYVRGFNSGYAAGATSKS